MNTKSFTLGVFATLVVVLGILGIREIRNYTADNAARALKLTQYRDRIDRLEADTAAYRKQIRRDIKVLDDYKVDYFTVEQARKTLDR